MFLKWYKSIVLIGVVLIFLFLNGQLVVFGEKFGDSSLIKTNVIKVNKKFVKISIKNKSKKYRVFYHPGFELEKYKNKKWKRIRFKTKKAYFARTAVLDKREKRIVKIKWKDYYKKNLSKGKYRLHLVRNNIFHIKK